MLSSKIKNIFLKRVNWNSIFLLSNVVVGSIYFLGFLAIVNDWIIFTANTDEEMVLGSLVWSVIFIAITSFFIILNFILEILQIRSTRRWIIRAGLITNTFLVSISILGVVVYILECFVSTGAIVNR
jgi:hypothetical protein